MIVKVYADREHYSPPHRKQLIDILKSQWNDATVAQRLERYGKWPASFRIVDAPGEADLHLLTMKWPHYVDLGRIDEAKAALDVARRWRKPFVIFSYGDFEANLPFDGDDIHLFQPSAYRSRRRTSNHGLPAFIDDPLAGFGDGNVQVRPKRMPVVGFCGQAGASVARHVARYLRNRYKYVAWRVGRERWEPPPIEHTWFRQRVLDSFTESSIVETNYVLRKKYRAGVHTDDRNDPKQDARRAFLENVRDTDYTVSVRGSGNFSVRFYEALAMGRFPAFVDTDCILPFHDDLDWRALIPWIDQAKIADAPTYVADFHARMSDAEYGERQLECRELWKSRLTPDGFYDNFWRQFPELRNRY